jgi:N-methylhydantoinase A/oxoprolinase/acetone carboxylase beta subunit
VIDVDVRMLEAMVPGAVLTGPAIVESPVTTVVVDARATAVRLASGSLLIDPWGPGGRPLAARDAAASA